MEPRPLGNTGLRITPLGFGAVKIGRNESLKYPQTFDLPTLPQVSALLHGVLDLGVNYIDTAPAYGVSEQRIGETLSARRDQFVISTKVGERFRDGRSSFDFSTDAAVTSVHNSLRLLRTDVLDIVFIHSNGDDLRIMRQTDVVATLQALRDQGLIRAIGLSGKTVHGAREALQWADVIMVTFNRDDDSHAAVMRDAAAKGVGVIVKKGLGSGTLPAAEAIGFVVRCPAVDSLVIGGLSLAHVSANIAAAEAALAGSNQAG